MKIALSAALEWAVLLERETANCVITKVLTKGELAALRSEPACSHPWVFEAESVDPLLADALHVTELTRRGLFLAVGAGPRDEPVLCIEDLVRSRRAAARWDETVGTPWCMPLCAPVLNNGEMNGIVAASRAACIPLTMSINN